MDILVLASIFHVFLSACAAPSHDSSARGTTGELIQVLKNNTNLWLYKRTNGESGHKCLHWEKGNFDKVGTTYDFHEVYWSDGKRQRNPLKGEITSIPSGKNQGAALKVEGHSEGGDNVEYLLVNWNSTEQCGIFYTEKLTEDGQNRETQTCGLYFGDKTVNNESLVKTCLAGYDHYCTEYKKGEQEQIIYTSDCQRLQGC
uniref:Lipocalin n=1 Tax=Rhipicephalus appendiculatus TaxID=34631 RepID=A0A131YRY1_RHIAP